MHRRLALWCFLVLCAVTISPGCRLLKWKQAEGTEDVMLGLRVSELRPFDDAPIPQGFRRVGAGRVDKTPEYRSAWLKYKGRPEVARVSAFFLDEMPISGWVLLLDTEALGVRTMFFLKGDESCTISIRRKLFYTYFVLTLHDKNSRR